MEKNNNTTKLVNALATLLPPLFLEARIFSGGKQLELVTQLGLSIPTTQNMDIAIFTRTSGAAFAVGIGSFVAYKMLCRLIKSNCIWTALEQLSQTEELKKEQKASNNETICLAEGFYAVRLGGENDLLKRLDEFLSSSSTTTTNKLEKGKQRIAVVQVRQANALKRLFRRSQHLNQTGIASIDQQLNFNEKFNKIDTIASRGDIFNYYNNNKEEEILNDYNDNNNEDIKNNLSNNNNYCSSSCNISSSSSNTFCSKQNSSISSKSSNKTCKSVSIQINCENELFWEDEFSNNEEEEKRREEEIEEDFCDDEGLFLFREREGSLGGISQLSAMKNLEKMFCNDWLNKNINEEENEENINYNLLDNALNNLREMSSLDDVANTSSSYSSLHNYEQTKQLINYPKDESKPSFTAYKIVLQNELSESSSSLCGGSTRSDIFGRYCCPSSPHRQQRKRLDNNKISTSQGLWELTNDGTNSRLMSEKQCLKIYESKDRNNSNGLMVDSIISINSSHASSSLGNSSLQIQMPNSDIMIDSAIGTDFQSSADDDDWVKEQQNMEEGEIIELGNILKKNGGIFRRFGGGEIEYNNNNNKGINLLNKINEQSNTTTPIKKIIKSSLSNLSINESETSLEWF